MNFYFSNQLLVNFIVKLCAKHKQKIPAGKDRDEICYEKVLFWQAKGCGFFQDEKGSPLKDLDSYRLGIELD